MENMKNNPNDSLDEMERIPGQVDKLNMDVEFGRKLSVNDIIEEAQKCLDSLEVVPHKKIFELLLRQIKKVDFREQAELIDDDELQRKHYLVCVIENILLLARKNNWGICRNNDFIYLYNGQYWSLIDVEELQIFLGEAAEMMGVYKFDARVYHFREQLYKQFIAAAHLPRPEPNKDVVLINLINGTFEVGAEKHFLRLPTSRDFITYQLPFEFNPNSVAPKFLSFLEKVLPDKECQFVLAEFLGYIFINPSILKLEKALLLFGSGANGKSVIFEIVNALFGRENVCNYSLNSLTKHDSYQRAELGNKLINYGSEINGKLEASIFKQLVSGEPVEARRIYGKPFMLRDYAKLIFNCNELPKDVEQTTAYFRRFLIIPFGVTIPEEEQDKELAKLIIKDELSGIFNWVLDGLSRLLRQKNFSECNAAMEQLKQYRKQSDTVLMFLEEEDFQKSANDFTSLSELFNTYKQYCNNYGHHYCSLKTFGERLRNNGLIVERKSHGNIVFVKKYL